MRNEAERVDAPVAILPGQAGSTMDERERARWEIAALAGRLRAVEAERDDWEHRCEQLTRERDRERRIAGKLQRSDSYRLGRAVVSFVRNPVRSSPWLVRGAIRRLRAIPGGVAGKRVAPAQPARRPARSGEQRLPVHLYVAIGLAPESLRALVRTVSQRVLVNADHVPVVVTDCPTFSLLRTFPVLLEYVPDREAFARHRADLRWDDVLSERLAQLIRDHGSTRTVVVDRRHPPNLAQLLALDSPTP